MNFRTAALAFGAAMPFLIAGSDLAEYTKNEAASVVEEDGK
jgi:hypothetical protein